MCAPPRVASRVVSDLDDDGTATPVSVGPLSIGLCMTRPETMGRTTESAYAASLVWSLQFALLSPSLALFLSSSLGADEGQVGLVLALFNASGFISSLLIPMLADRRNEYLKIMTACGVSAIAMAGTLSLVSSLPLAAAIVLVTLGGPAGVGGSLLFACPRSVH